MQHENRINVAKNAGFCFGVKRATDKIESRCADADGTRIYIIGELIHNGIYNAALREKGVRVITVEDVSGIAGDSDGGVFCEVYIRTHGIPKQDEEMLRALEEKHRNFKITDMTCPFVKRIHKIADENTGEDTLFLLLGSHGHPEAEGIMSYAKGDKEIFSNSAELERILDNYHNVDKKVIFAAQTTQNSQEYKKCKKILEKVYTNPIYLIQYVMLRKTGKKR